MKVIAFKNGDKIKVNDIIVDKLKMAILSKDGAGNFQFFTNSSTGNTELVINVSEISSIYSYENIV